MPKNCKCPHLDNTILQLSLSELCRLKQGVSCTQCDANGPNLWICLTKTCLHIGCSENVNDHSTIHYKQNPSHCVHMNQSSQRIWCYKCLMEVFIINHGYNDIKLNHRQTIDTDDHSCNEFNRNIMSGHDLYGITTNGEHDSSADDDCESEQSNYSNCSGLVGLQNIANTCYMNAALQALSNTPPLTGYFLECGDIIEANYEMAAPTSIQRKTGLARSYYRLVKDMWLRHKRKPGKFGYVVPNGILYGIRNVHPMFRGFQQHDTQEFLRCFMDQLHEELKELTPPPPELLSKTSNVSLNYLHGNNYVQFNGAGDDRSGSSTPSLSQSEAEYETCDSGVSEQSSLSDEISSIHRTIPKSINAQNQSQSITNYSRSPSPTNSQRTFKSTHSSIKNTRSNSITSLNSMQNATSEQDTDKCDANSKLPQRSIISDVFDGKLLSSVQCLTCDRVSTREETFQDLSLPIPGKDHLNVLHQTQGLISPLPIGLTPDAVYQATQDGWFWWLWHWVRSFFWGPAVTLHDCMSAFFSADELKGDNMYSCEKCNKLRNGMKFSRVLELPEMLCVHLKRFRHDLSYSSKISSPVHFPLVGLDMRPYLHKECKSKVSTYDLTAVICHHGTVGGGHYTSFAKHEITGKWFEFDDQMVREVSTEFVQNCEAYVLFYRKSNPQMTLIRHQAMQIEDLNTEQTSGIRFFVSRQWLNRFKTFAEPGPIDNWALLCPHGGLSPNKARMANRLVVPLPQSLWDYLFEKFGGGPACNHLFECDICRQQADAITRRQNYELDEFSEFKDETTSTIYAISMNWFRQWQLFVGKVTDEIPGPINNTSIALQNDVGVSRGVKPGSDYAQINSTLWKFFYNIYGGGPEIILRGNPEEIRSTPKDERNLNDSNVDKDETMPQCELKKTPDDSIKSNANSSQNSDKNAHSNSKKVPKNVSFEDNDSNGSDRDGMFEQSFFYLRRGKHYYSTSPTATTEILNKKDRRLRSSIKANGFFGPEGKYSANSFHEDNQPTNSNQTLDIEANKKLDEITPLLHQATISLTNANEQDDDASANSSANRSASHKTSYRKRVKMKIIRKI